MHLLFILVAINALTFEDLVIECDKNDLKCIGAEAKCEKAREKHNIAKDSLDEIKLTECHVSQRVKCESAKINQPETIGKICGITKRAETDQECLFAELIFAAHKVFGCCEAPLAECKSGGSSAPLLLAFASLLAARRFLF